MCVICFKPKGVNLPKEKILRQCWESNPHGAGIAVHKHRSDHIEYVKGFRHFEDLMNHLNTANLSKDDAIVYHFRLATSGGINQEMCHPFQITSDVSELKALCRSNCDTPLIFHNGVVGGGTKDLSDTALLAKRIADKHLSAIEELEKYTSYNKFVYMTQHDIQLLGKWVQENDLYFSNDSYKWNIWLLDDKKEKIVKPSCPHCHSKKVSLISKKQNEVFECNRCGCIMDGYRNILFAGKGYNGYKRFKI